MPDSLGTRLKRWFLAEPERTPRRDELECTRIADCRPRERVEIGGTITQHGVNLEFGWYEAQLTDPTGSVLLIWMGRQRVDCLHDGAVVTARGRLAKLDDQLVLYNPEFSVLPGTA